MLFNKYRGLSDSHAIVDQRCDSAKSRYNYSRERRTRDVAAMTRAVCGEWRSEVNWHNWSATASGLIVRYRACYNYIDLASRARARCVTYGHVQWHVHRDHTLPRTGLEVEGKKCRYGSPPTFRFFRSPRGRGQTKTFAGS